MSRGFKAGDAVSISQGPLVGQQARIKRINRRKSTALIEFEFVRSDRVCSDGSSVDLC